MLTTIIGAVIAGAIGLIGVGLKWWLSQPGPSPIVTTEGIVDAEKQDLADHTSGPAAVGKLRDGTFGKPDSRH